MFSMFCRYIQRMQTRNNSHYRIKKNEGVHHVFFARKHRMHTLIFLYHADITACITSLPTASDSRAWRLGLSILSVQIASCCGFAE